MGRKLTLPEAALVVRRSVKTLYAWTSKKSIPHLKVGGRVLFDEDELETWMEGCRVGMPVDQRQKP